MGSVAVTVSVAAVTGEVGQEGSTTLELGVGGGDTSVDDVGASTRTGSAVVGVGRGTTSDVGDTTKTPGSRGLSDVGLLLERLRGAKVGLDNGILLDVVNTLHVAESLDNVVGNLSRETTKGAELVDVRRVLLDDLQGSGDEVVEVVGLQVVPHLDNVLSGDGSTLTRNNDWGREGHCQRQESDDE